MLIRITHMKSKMIEYGMRVKNKSSEIKSLPVILSESEFEVIIIENNQTTINDNIGMSKNRIPRMKILFLDFKK